MRRCKIYLSLLLLFVALVKPCYGSGLDKDSGEDNKNATDLASDRQLFPPKPHQLPVFGYRYAILLRANQTLAVDLYGGLDNDGTRFQLYPKWPQGAANQLFVFRTTGEIICMRTNKVIDISASRPMEDPARQWTSLGLPSQRFTVTEDGRIKWKDGFLTVTDAKPNALLYVVNQDLPARQQFVFELAAL